MVLEKLCISDQNMELVCRCEPTSEIIMLGDMANMDQKEKRYESRILY